MKQIAIVGAVLAFACVGCASSPYAQDNNYARQDTVALMSKEDVIALSNAGVSGQVIIDQIRASGSYFELTSQDIIDLKNAGVSDSVVTTMIKTQEMQKHPVERGRYYYPYFWDLAYPYPYPWYPSMYLGFSFGRYYPHYGFIGRYGFYRGHHFGGGRRIGRHR